MADTESIRESVESRAPFSTWLGVILLFSLFGAIVFAVVGPAPRGDNYEQIRAKNRVEKLKAIRETDTKQLTAYSWLDKNKGVVGLPLDRAMTLTVAELAARKPAAAYPIATPAAPEASAAPAGPATATPAPAVSPTPSGTPKPTSVAGPSSESRGQPAAAVVPPPAPPATQPGAPASAAASPAPRAAKPKPSPSPEKTP